MTLKEIQVLEKVQSYLSNQGDNPIAVKLLEEVNAIVGIAFSTIDYLEKSDGRL